MKSLFLLLPTLAGISISLSAADPLPVSATTSNSKPTYDSLLDALSKNDSVMPPLPKGHPVDSMYNREGIIPPQCYTKNDQTFNACYVCHQSPISGRENVMDDIDLQREYSFSPLGMTNHWKNLFEDRRERVSMVSDEEILNYVSQENYSELAGRLEEGGFQGWIPEMKDLHLGDLAFDEEGFARDGSNWVAFNYKPFPSTFWPTNGSTDDVMIRLPEIFRTDLQGGESRDVYRANLAILEANMKGLEEISCLPVDERAVGRDLDGDGKIGTAGRIVDVTSYVGGATKVEIHTHLYPGGTEFMHSVRYLGLDEGGQVTFSPRMKELRYMKKWRAYSKPVYARQYQLEGFEKEAGNLPGYHNLEDNGLDNGNGWAISGFIEDKAGRLRSLTYEEKFSCMGCHNSIGSTIDKTFSFARKVEGAEGWGYLNLRGMPDAPNVGEVEGEILTYLKRVGGGSEFRNNDEMKERWFKDDGSLDEKKLAKAKDVYELITPSRERALMLNKAYRTIVEDQDFIYGKDATVEPPKNVFQRIDNETALTLPPERQYRWNIMLDWRKTR